MRAREGGLFRKRQSPSFWHMSSKHACKFHSFRLSMRAISLTRLHSRLPFLYLRLGSPDCFLLVNALTYFRCVANYHSVKISDVQRFTCDGVYAQSRIQASLILILCDAIKLRRMKHQRSSIVSRSIDTHSVHRKSFR